MHVYVRRANFPTKTHFEIVKWQSFAYWIPKTGELLSMQQKSANTKNFAYRRGFKVKFAWLTADVIMHEGHSFSQG